jgi:hypothetical protein
VFKFHKKIKKCIHEQCEMGQADSLQVNARTIFNAISSSVLFSTFTILAILVPLCGGGEFVRPCLVLEHPHGYHATLASVKHTLPLPDVQFSAKPKFQAVESSGCRRTGSWDLHSAVLCLRGGQTEGVECPEMADEVDQSEAPMTPEEVQQFWNTQQSSFIPPNTVGLSLTLLIKDR